MIKVYICPKCGWMPTVSRRKNVECYKCGEQEMFQVKLTYDKYSEMTLKEREDYSDSWLYIHLRNLKEQNV